MALHQQMEQQRLRWKSEIVSSNSMLNTVGGLWVSRLVSLFFLEDTLVGGPSVSHPLQPELLRQLPLCSFIRGLFTSWSSFDKVVDCKPRS